MKITRQSYFLPTSSSKIRQILNNKNKTPLEPENFSLFSIKTKQIPKFLPKLAQRLLENTAEAKMKTTGKSLEKKAKKSLAIPIRFGKVSLEASNN